MNLTFYWTSSMFKINRKYFFRKWRKMDAFFHNISSTILKSRPFVILGIGIGNRIGIDITNVIVSSSITLMDPNLAWWWLRMRRLHPQSHATFDVVVTWQIKYVIFTLSQGLWTPNLAGSWLRMKGPHPQSHVTHWSRCQVTNQRRYIFIFTRPMDPKPSWVVT